MSGQTDGTNIRIHYKLKIDLVSSHLREQPDGVILLFSGRPKILYMYLILMVQLLPVHSANNN